MINDAIIAVIVAGILIGLGAGMTLKFGGALGGSDVLGVLVRKRYPVSQGTVAITVNAVILIATTAMQSLESAVYSLVAIYISSVVIDNILEGFNRTKMVLVVSDKWHKFTPLLLEELGRGVTFLPGEGAYTGQQYKIAYCVVKNMELPKLKRIIMESDKNAFLTVINAKEVQGRGFVEKFPS